MCWDIGYHGLLGRVGGYKYQLIECMLFQVYLTVGLVGLNNTLEVLFFTPSRPNMY